LNYSSQPLFPILLMIQLNLIYERSETIQMTLLQNFNYLLI
jgi:hypothetical protein